MGALSALALLASPALAGPEDGTLTVALAGPVEAIDIYMGPGPEVAMMASGVFSPLVAFDTQTRSDHGVIAESWQQIDDLTMEFHLRPGLVFQDGSALDAEDVAYTVNFIVNPDTRFRLKSRFAAFAGAEAVDPLTVRVRTHQPFPMLMARMVAFRSIPRTATRRWVKTMPTGAARRSARVRCGWRRSTNRTAW